MYFRSFLVISLFIQSIMAVVVTRYGGTCCRIKLYVRLYELSLVFISSAVINQRLLWLVWNSFNSKAGFWNENVKYYNLWLLLLLSLYWHSKNALIVDIEPKIIPPFPKCLSIYLKYTLQTLCKCVLQCTVFALYFHTCTYIKFMFHLRWSILLCSLLLDTL